MVVFLTNVNYATSQRATTYPKPTFQMEQGENILSYIHDDCFTFQTNIQSCKAVYPVYE